MNGLQRERHKGVLPSMRFGEELRYQSPAYYRMRRVGVFSSSRVAPQELLSLVPAYRDRSVFLFLLEKAKNTPSPSESTEVGRKILSEHPGTGGSLGCAISEAVEVALNSNGDYRYVLGSVLNQMLMHQTLIGLEARAAFDKYGENPDIIIGCAGGGSVPQR